jgi:hypothetical protein
MYREQEKQISKNRKEFRTMKHFEVYEYQHAQAERAQQESNRAYGFQIRREVR